jgi:hypothetical protein
MLSSQRTHGKLLQKCSTEVNEVDVDKSTKSIAGRSRGNLFDRGGED